YQEATRTPDHDPPDGTTSPYPILPTHQPHPQHPRRTIGNSLYGRIPTEEADSNPPTESPSRVFVATVPSGPTARLIPRDVGVQSVSSALEWLSCSAECVRRCACSACPWRAKSPLTEPRAGATSDVHRPPHAGMV